MFGERKTRFIRKLYKFTFIIYEVKSIFLSNLFFFFTIEANFNFSNLGLKTKHKPNYKSFFFLLCLN
jgi:hypothetical protein